MTFSSSPAIVVVAGPTGAGKTTAAPYLLRDTWAFASTSTPT
jgi:HrpA-like RNA helicase